MNRVCGDKQKIYVQAGKLLLLVLGTALFLLAAYCVLFRGNDFWHLWLASGQNNDEVSYNRQLAGVLAYGQPVGVFGYNESRAQVGHFAAWSPLIFFLYAIPAKLVGMGINTMFWCNILFIVCGWVIFACAARLSWKQQLCFGGGVLLAAQPLYQVFSGTAEPLHYFLLFCILGGTIAMKRKFHPGWFWLAAVACFFVTILRAYTALLWLLPILVLWKGRCRGAFLCVGMACFSLVLYEGITLLFGAPFFSGQGIDLQAVNLLLKGKPVDAVAYQWDHVLRQFQAVWSDYILPLASGKVEQPVIALFAMFGILLVTILTMVYDAKRGRSIQIRAGVFVCVVLCQLALLVLYTAEPTLNRHYTMLILMLLAAVVYESGISLAIWVPLLLLQILLPVSQAMDALPTYDAELDRDIQAIHAALEEADAACTSEDVWDHTLAFAFRDAFHGYLYAVPDGMGIQFDHQKYLWDPDNKINSRYVMTAPGTGSEERLLQDGWEELLALEDVVIYMRTDDVQ